MSVNDLKFAEFSEHLLNDEKPSEYFNRISLEKWFIEEPPFNMLVLLKSTMQHKLHHPEGDVWKHTMLVVDNAAFYKTKSKDPKSFMWAALLHDLGKPSTTKIYSDKITAYDHDKVGEKLAEQFLRKLTENEAFINDVIKLVRWHMQILFVNKNLPFGDIKSMKRETDVDEIALLGLCDRLGRGNMTDEKIKQEKNNIDVFLSKCSLKKS